MKAEELVKFVPDTVEPISTENTSTSTTSTTSTTSITVSNTESTFASVEQPKVLTKPVQPIPGVYVALKYTSGFWGWAFYPRTEAELAKDKENFDKVEADKQAVYQEALREYEAANPSERSDLELEQKVESPTTAAEQQDVVLATTAAPILHLALANFESTDVSEEPKVETRKRSRSR